MPTNGILPQLLAALAAALLGAAVASRLRQSVVIGYLLAGIAIGPFTPGFIGDTATLQALADLGIIFLMFTIGVQLSLRELVRQSRPAVVGGTVQVLVMVGLGWLVGRTIGLSDVEALFLGAVVSNSSSTVLSKLLSDRNELDTAHARLGLAWSSVQDISATAMIALLPVISAGSGAPDSNPLGDLVKAAVFLLVLGPLAFLFLPRILQHVERFRSRELFVLAVTTVALSMAFFASLLGVSVALGALLAGAIVGESDLSHRVLGDTVPLRDVFSGLFFVAIGMLMNPAYVLEHAGLVLVTLLLIVLVKGGLTAAITRLLGGSRRVSARNGAGLAQSGEFSFLLAQVGIQQGLLSEGTFNLALSAAVGSILLLPAVYGSVPWVLRTANRFGPDYPPGDAGPSPAESDVVVCGFGRVGQVVASLLDRFAIPYLVIEEDRRIALALRDRGGRVLLGDAASQPVLEAARLKRARVLIVCIPESMAARRIVDYARVANPDLVIVARTHSSGDRRDLLRRGVQVAVLGELELALEIGRNALRSCGVGVEEAEGAVEAVRAEVE